MSDHTPPFSHLIASRDLPQKTPRHVVIEADEADRAALAKVLGVRSISTLRLDVWVKAVGEGLWSVEGDLKAKLTQNCVVTLAPVPANIAEPVQRLFSQDVTEDLQFDIDVDIEEDDPPDAVGDGVDLGAVAVETLTLALDPYPRAPGADFAPLRTAPPGVTPMTPEQAKPFAGLAALKKAMDDGE